MPGSGIQNPIVRNLKLRLSTGWCTGGGLATDISLGTVNGARAVFYVCSQLQALPALRPLVLAVKAFLRQRGLNEVKKNS